MKYYGLVRALLFQLLLQYVCSQSIRAIYLFKDVMKSNTTALKTSGFNSLIIFGVGVLSNGDIEYYSNTPGSSDVLIASNGAYVGGDSLANKVKSFKTGTTGVNRLEISMNAQNIQSLMASPGPGSGTRLYKNFQALKSAWSLDAVNNDDESIYDVSSTVAFGKMLSAIGYKYTIAPYTNSGFWSSVKSQLGSILDRTYLQCYDGGAGNDPGSWQSTLGMKVVPLLWVINDSKPSYGTSPSSAKTQFTNWKSQYGIAGGGYWNDYDIEKMGSSYTQYGAALTSVFP